MWTFTANHQIQFTGDTAKCIELRNGSAANNTPVQVYDCNGTSGQTWYAARGGPVQAVQVQDGNGACLQPKGGSAANGTLLELDACSATGAAQGWYWDGYGSLHFAASPTQCLDVPAQAWANGVPANYTQLQIWACDSGTSQDQLTALQTGNNIKLGSADTSCVEARNGSASNGTAAQVFSCNGTTGQTWFPRLIGSL